MKSIAAVISTLCLMAHVPPALAIEGGQPAVGAPEIAALLHSQTASRSSCSASFIDPMIVITAAHCVTLLNSENGELLEPPLGFWVSAPGEDLNLPDYSKRIKVKSIFRSSGYVNTWNPAIGDYRTQVDDIAFLVLEKELSQISKREIASAEEIAAIKQAGGLIQHFGYGLQSKQRNEGRPYSISLQAHPLGSSRYSNNPALDHKTITTNETGSMAICPGDSGSPWFANINGQKKLVAVTVGGSGCGGSGVNGALGTVVAYYNDLYTQALYAAQEIRDAENVAKAKRVLAASQKRYASCSSMWKIFPGGIAKNMASAKKYELTNKAYANSLAYAKNRQLDKDKDGVVCER